MDEREAALLKRIGNLIRGDWSGTYFDGRDVRDMINMVIEGKGKYQEAEDYIKHLEANYNYS